MARLSVVPLWALAAAGITGAGLGLLGLRPFAAPWRRYLLTGLVGSLVWLGVWRDPMATPGIVLDLLLLVWATRPSTAHARESHAIPRGRHRIGAMLGTLHIAVLALLILVYPWHRRWGSTEAELIGTLPGDTPMERPTYLVQHAVTIDAPAGAVWPWQRLAVGDSIFATPKGWLGLAQRLGWRVSEVDAQRVIVLEAWGAFILLPEGTHRTRLVVRSRSAAPARTADLLFAPLGFLVFEPAHFIMERKMLTGITARAEWLRDVPPVICDRHTSDRLPPP